MMMLLIFVLCCSVFQVFVVAVLVLSRGNFLVFISNENEMTMMSSKGKIFDESCLSKMMILLIFVLCCSVCFRFLSWLCWCYREEIFCFSFRMKMKWRWWVPKVKSSMHPVYQKWWYCWYLFCVFQVFVVAVLVSSRGGGFIFFLPFISLAVLFSDLTTLPPYFSFFGSCAFWLLFNTAWQSYL